MARAARLKVFRTAIGFHDAYVAAPSRAAALRAWGSEKDLFARGAAEEVTDAALIAEPLARPGEVVKRSRGTVAEQLAALPVDRPRRARAAAPAAPAPEAPAKQRAPRPDRAELDAAEAAVTDAAARQARILAAITEREAALARERQAAEREGREETRRLERARDQAVAAHARAVAAWEAGSG